MGFENARYRNCTALFFGWYDAVRRGERGYKNPRYKNCTVDFAVATKCGKGYGLRELIRPL